MSADKLRLGVRQRFVLSALGVPPPEPSADWVSGIALRTKVVPIVVPDDLPAELLQNVEGGCIARVGALVAAQTTYPRVFRLKSSMCLSSGRRSRSLSDHTGTWTAVDARIL